MYELVQISFYSSMTIIYESVHNIKNCKDKITQDNMCTYLSLKEKNKLSCILGFWGAEGGGMLRFESRASYMQLLHLSATPQLIAMLVLK